MKKFRLIKTYPGSPELGIICEERNNKSSFCYYYEGEKNLAIQKDQVENQPEYWEKIEEDNTCYIVLTKKDEFFEPYKAYRIEGCLYQRGDTRQYFKTKDEAEGFILLNKPCLSYNDIASYFKLNPIPNGFNGYTLFPLGLKDIIKSKI